MLEHAQRAFCNLILIFWENAIHVQTYETKQFFLFFSKGVTNSSHEIEENRNKYAKYSRMKVKFSGIYKNKQNVGIR